MFSIESDSGRGRASVLLYEADASRKLLTTIQACLPRSGRLLVVSTQTLNPKKWKSDTDSLLDFLEKNSIRQVSFITLGSISALVLSAAIQNSKIVRSLFLIDPTTRIHASKKDRWIDFLEEKLPLGLPFRMRSEGFYSLPYLHRIRCPVLVLSSPKESPDERVESRMLAERMPTAWAISHGSWSELEGSLQNEVELFSDMPRKAPQKGSMNTN